MTELELKYGCNPNQKPARIFMDRGALPDRPGGVRKRSSSGGRRRGRRRRS